jgi:hypothetical protein
MAVASSIQLLRIAFTYAYSLLTFLPNVMSLIYHRISLLHIHMQIYCYEFFYTSLKPTLYSLHKLFETGASPSHDKEGLREQAVSIPPLSHT